VPRPKRKIASNRFAYRPHRISDDRRATLQKLLGLDRSHEHAERRTRAIAEAERELGLYEHGYMHLDHPPRPVDYVRTFSTVATKAREFLKGLGGLSGYYQSELARRGYQIEVLNQHLESLSSIAMDVVSANSGRPSKGARRATALHEVIRRLRRVFRTHYRGPFDKPRPARIFAALTQQERAELEFVRLALIYVGAFRPTRVDTGVLSAESDEGIECQAKAARKVLRYFRDSRSLLTEERDIEFERIVEHSRSRPKESLPWEWPPPVGQD